MAKLCRDDVSADNREGKQSQLQTATSTVNIDNDCVRVTTWAFRPGDRTGAHRHELPYVIIPVTGGSLRLETTEGANASTQVPGEPYFRDAGAKHDVINEGPAQLVFVEVELKSWRALLAAK